MFNYAYIVNQASLYNDGSVYGGDSIAVIANDPNPVYWEYDWSRPQQVYDMALSVWAEFPDSITITHAQGVASSAGYPLYNVTSP